jgi:uncharacterized protein (TIGR02266 family)
MTDSSQSSDKSDIKARLKQLSKDISTFADHASEDRQLALWSMLEEQRLQALLYDSSDESRRRAPRKPCSISVHYAIEDRLLTDIAKNISTGGVFIETFAPLSVGQEITLSISPPNQEEPIETAGEIVWSGSKGMGVRFTTESEDLEAMIEGL